MSKTSYSKLLIAQLCVEIFALTMFQMALHFAYRKKQMLKQNLNYFFSGINNKILKGTLCVVLRSVLTNRLKAKALLMCILFSGIHTVFSHLAVS